MFSVAHLFVLSFVIIITQGGVSVHNPFYCYSEDPIRQWTGLGGIHAPNTNVSTCNPSKFWMSGRHGARYPLIAELPDLIRIIPALHSQILTNYNQGKTSLCASDFELLRNWQLDVTMDDADYLTESGWIEMEAKAKRLQAAFPTLLPSTYSPNDYFFRSSDNPRTIDSLYAFADGLFGVDMHKQVEFADIPHPDYLIRAFLECPIYLEIDNIRTEQNTFIEGPEYQKMVRQVSAKLGFHGSHVLRNIEVLNLALYCKYEQGWNLNYTYPSPFCTAFSVANAEVLEYAQDINWYRRIGYGRPEYRRLYENVMCNLFQDMLRFIQSNDVNDHKARIFTGHISSSLILLHFEAFAGDSIFTWHDFAQQTNRVWRSNELYPHASNLVVIRYDCADGDNDLLFLYNEIPLQIPGCDSNGVCKQSLILERFSRHLNANCMEIFCTNS